MAEKEEVFSSGIKYKGIFSFKDYYKFCYEWVTEEIGLDLEEKKYKEQVVGNSKNIEILWQGSKKITDYFKWVIKVSFLILDLQG